jgi:hypothetical protein
MDLRATVSFDMESASEQIAGVLALIEQVPMLRQEAERMVALAVLPCVGVALYDQEEAEEEETEAGEEP